ASFRYRYTCISYPPPSVPGGGHCLDAFMVALNQACDGHVKRWYVSTLE
ncbi:unnamed protein product, partial [Ectocarpus fasciculatus]